MLINSFVFRTTINLIKTSTPLLCCDRWEYGTSVQAFGIFVNFEILVFLSFRMTSFHLMLQSQLY
jgi:hypothetical protein